MVRALCDKQGHSSAKDGLVYQPGMGITEIRDQDPAQPPFVVVRLTKTVIAFNCQPERPRRGLRFLYYQNPVSSFFALVGQMYARQV